MQDKAAASDPLLLFIFSYSVVNGRHACGDGIGESRFCAGRIVMAHQFEPWTMQVGGRLDAVAATGD